MKKNKNKSLKTVEDVITGTIIVDNKEFIKDKDFKLTPDGLELTEIGEKKLNNKNVQSYSMFYARKIVKRK